YRITDKNGGVKWVFERGSLIKDENKEIFIEGVFFDITDQVIAESRIRESEMKYKSLFENAKEGLLILDGDVYVDCNPEAERIFEADKDYIRGKTPYFFSPPRQQDGRESREKTAEFIKRALAGENMFFEWVHKTRRGKKIISEIRLDRFKSGGKFYLMVFIRDITKRAEEKAKMERDAHILSAVHDSVFLSDRQGRLVYVNEAAAKELEYKKEELEGMEYNGILESGAKESFNEIAGTTLKQGKYVYEAYHISKSGKKTPVEGAARKITIGGTEHILFVSRDITKRKKALDDLFDAFSDLEESDKMKSNFISIVSHEMRTPVTIIKGFTAFMKKGMGGKLSVQQRDFVDIIETNTKRLEHVINDLVDMSKIESNTFVIEKQPMDLMSMVDSCVKDMRTIAEPRGIKIDFKGSGKRFVIDADKGRLSQAVINIINNSLKFSADNSRVVVTAGEEKEIEIPAKIPGKEKDIQRYYIKIADSGIGFESEVKEKIFERFFQAEDVNKRKYQGMGIGLSIAKTAVELHGGYIWCESEGKGKGAEFFMLIPEK
ncbi:MAG TPA: PAS domain S-box protein, partial [Firmicutes bacterium]|nr:PAS domain S-box protein [Bacillota bacterium]